MIALMPIAAEQTIDSRVMDGLRNQTTPCSLIVCATKGIVDSQRVYNADRATGESASRDMCSDTAKWLRNQYVLSIDRDVQLTDKTAIELMVGKLNTRPDLGAVALSFEEWPKQDLYPHHINIRCTVFRRELFAFAPWKQIQRYRCACSVVRDYLKYWNFGIEYLDYKPRAIELI